MRNQKTDLQPRSALLLEDVPEVSDALAGQLETLFPGIAVHRAYSLQQARNFLATHVAVELGLIDLQLPDGSGFELIGELLSRQPDCIAVITTLYADDEHLFPALRAGACGYLLKDDPPERTAAALRGMVNGEPTLSPSIAHRLLRTFLLYDAASTVGLDSGEREILSLVSKGYSLREVTQRLSLSLHTISMRLKDIYRKLDANERASASPRKGLPGVA